MSMRKCVNCFADIVGDGRQYPGSNILPEQPSGIVCRPCEQDLIAANNRQLRKDFEEREAFLRTHMRELKMEQR